MGTFNINRTEKEILLGLKDFQRATVERIYDLYREKDENGAFLHRRVLVADEVGMGKTLIARGVIAKTARLRIEEGDTFFKIVYVCSNTSIANQNISKLKISEEANIDSVSDTRLSMQHLKIAEQEALQRKRSDDFAIQLMPLTPGTSFNLTTGGGIVNERALMYAILIRMERFKKYGEKPIEENFLQRLMIYGADVAWGWAQKHYEDRVKALEKDESSEYPESFIRQLEEYAAEDNVLDDLEIYLRELEDGTSAHKKTAADVINELRIMFARESASALQPDLVIMDEFQRFKSLLKAEDASDMGILRKRFFGGSDTRILLLSATPYKLYSTLDEIEESKIDEHYEEFLTVMKFLLGDGYAGFEEVWKNYSVALREFSKNSTTILQIKDRAETEMYKGVCRTERISVMDSGDYTDDSSVKSSLEIAEKDILSYRDMHVILQEMGGKYSVPADYVKSCPYLLSYMKNYKLKERVEGYFRNKENDINKAKSNNLWLRKGDIENYKELPKANARLEKLKEIAFENHAENYLWIPPSMPYYPMKGAYRNSGFFSKVLVFSAWEMVPRMIGSMISYEAERRTVGKLYQQERNIERKNANYFSKRRYPQYRLRFAVDKNDDPQRMTLFCLLYPSKTLSEVYDPVECLNKHMDLVDIERQVRTKIKEHMKTLMQYKRIDGGNDDAKWYYLAPMLMDGVVYAQNWINSLYNIHGDEDDNDTTSQKEAIGKAYERHIARISKLLGFVERGELQLGRIPDDMEDTLVDMAIASPAVCVYRSNGGNVTGATQIANEFLNYFNSTEATAVVELIYNRKHNKDNAHWQDVLKYCKDGCFQAMYDEYVHMVKNNVSVSGKADINSKIHDVILSSMRLHAVPYEVDTFQAFRERTQGINPKNRGMRMRAHYGVGFVGGDTDTVKNAARKDNIRGAFNSPLRPFVLATTSIGQEGLDFHYYCRRIMHWNLPTNPIDLEQREGRINRFKCLAIRQNVALDYGKNISFKQSVWDELFEAAKAEKQPGQSELVPFWCFGKNQEIKIERIVPMYPMSQDRINYERLIKILSLYRVTLGQARQEELLEYLFSEGDSTKLKDLFIDLSPYHKEDMVSINKRYDELEKLIIKEDDQPLQEN